MKKAVSTTLIILIIFSIFSTLSFKATTYSSGKYEYMILEDNTIRITKYNGNESEIHVIDKIDGLVVTEIGENAFSNNNSLVRIFFSNNIKNICDFAFMGCGNLKYVSFPEGLIKIGNKSFYKCYELVGVTEKNYGDEDDFYFIDNKKLIFPNTIKQIGK